MVGRRVAGRLETIRLEALSLFQLRVAMFSQSFPHPEGDPAPSVFWIVT